MTSYKQSVPLADRQAQVTKILAKYPHMIPVCVELNKKSNSILSDLPKKKHLVPGDQPFSYLQYQIRNRLKLKEKETIFFFVHTKDGVVAPVGTELMKQIYQKHRDEEDGMLYVTFMSQSFFGGFS